jgi:hypothetical protein
MRGIGWSCVALYCLVQLGIVSPDWLKGQWSNLTHRQNPKLVTPDAIERDMGGDGRRTPTENGTFYD